MFEKLSGIILSVGEGTKTQIKTCVAQVKRGTKKGIDLSSILQASLKKILPSGPSQTLNCILKFLRYDSVIGVVAEHDGTTERLVVPHQVFGNNFSRQESEVMSKSVAQFFAGW